MEQTPAQGDQGQMAEDEGQEQGGDLGSLVSNLYDGLNVLMTVVAKAQGIDPGVKQQMETVLKGFEGVVSAMGGQGGQQPAQATNTAPMEAGGSGAMPAGPQTR